MFPFFIWLVSSTENISQANFKGRLNYFFAYLLKCTDRRLHLNFDLYASFLSTDGLVKGKGRGRLQLTIRIRVRVRGKGTGGRKEARRKTEKKTIFGTSIVSIMI